MVPRSFLKLWPDPKVAAVSARMRGSTRLSVNTSRTISNPSATRRPGIVATVLFSRNSEIPVSKVLYLDFSSSPFNLFRMFSHQKLRGESKEISENMTTCEHQGITQRLSDHNQVNPTSNGSKAERTRMQQQISTC